MIWVQALALPSAVWLWISHLSLSLSSTCINESHDILPMGFLPGLNELTHVPPDVKASPQA